jgi:hypothetical protein
MDGLWEVEGDWEGKEVRLWQNIYGFIALVGPGKSLEMQKKTKSKKPFRINQAM